MIITSGDVEPRIVQDYDFVFLNGVALPITIDPIAGDSIEFLADRAVVRLSSKPSPSEVGSMMPAEETTIYMNNVILTTKRERSFIPASPEQRNDIRDFIKRKSSTTIH